LLSEEHIVRMLKAYRKYPRRFAADIWGIIPPKGRALLIEVKSPALIVRGKIEKDAGDLSEAQSAFLANAQDKGAIAIVAWAIWDVTDVFRRLGLIH
jgi:hypothetical protein